MILALFFSALALAADYGLYANEGDLVFLGADCLPKKTRDYVKSKDRTLLVKEGYTLKGGTKIRGMEFRSVELPDGKEIAKACKLEGAQFFSGGKLHPLKYGISFKYVETDKGSDCLYPAPRLEAIVHGAPKDTVFLLSSAFSLLQDKEKAEAEADFIRTAENLKKNDPGMYPWGYPKGSFSHEKEKGAVFIVTDQSEMGKKLALFRRKNKKWEQVDSAEFPPCGS